MNEFTAYKTGDRWKRKNSKDANAMRAMTMLYWSQKPITNVNPPPEIAPDWE